MKLQGLRQDLDLEREGRWVSMVGDFQVKVRRSNYEPFQSRIRELAAQAADECGGTLSPTQDRKVTAQAIAEELIVDWRGMEDDNDSPILFSKERAVELSQDDALLDLFADILAQAKHVDGYAVDLAARRAKK
ncbi:unnamed protein product [Scytosiphon promiscuus]